MTKSVIETYAELAKSNPPWKTHEEVAFIKSCTNKNGRWRSQAHKERFVNEALKHNIGLVFSLMHKHAFKERDDDAFQVAVIAMSNALKKYDPTTGNKISTWVVNPIRWAILQHQGAYSKAGTLAEEVSSLNHKRKTHFVVVSLDEPLMNDSSESFDTLSSAISMNLLVPDYVNERRLNSPSDEKFKNDVKLAINELLSCAKSFLSKKEIHIIKRTLKGFTQTEVAKELHLSKVRVNQLMKGAMRKIRSSSFGPKLSELMR